MFPQNVRKIMFIAARNVKVPESFPGQLFNLHVGDGLRFAVSNQDTRKGHNSRYKGGYNCVFGNWGRSSIG